MLLFDPFAFYYGIEDQFPFFISWDIGIASVVSGDSSNRHDYLQKG